MAELVAAAYVRGADVTETIATLSTAHITAPRTPGWCGPPDLLTVNDDAFSSSNEGIAKAKNPFIVSKNA